MKLRLIGYWSGGYGGRSQWPDPADLVDPQWDEEERTEVGYYLQHGLYARGFMGYSPCRLCSKVDNGSLELTDGTYLWRKGLPTTCSITAFGYRTLSSNTFVSGDGSWTRST